MKYGHLELHIEELLKEKGISKNTICKELDIPRSNFNRYCTDRKRSICRKYRAGGNRFY